MPGNIKLVAEKGPHTLHLQDALAVVHDSQLILAHQFTATLSSGKLKKMYRSNAIHLRRKCKFLVRVVARVYF